MTETAVIKVYKHKEPVSNYLQLRRTS